MTAFQNTESLPLPRFFYILKYIGIFPEYVLYGNEVSHMSSEHDGHGRRASHGQPDDEDVRSVGFSDTVV
jgi:hypothetical protein